jgi:protein-tyrosine-phosphatase
MHFRSWGQPENLVSRGIQWQLAHGEQPDVPSSYNVGMRWRWSAGYLRRLHAVFLGSLKPNAAGSSLRKDLFSSPFDLAPSVRDAIWDWFDPMAALTELCRMVKSLAGSDLRAVTKRALPRSLVFPLKSYKRLEGRERSVYIRMRLLRALGLHSDRKRKIPPDARCLVFICHGNIMRSPMSEALFKQFASDCDQHGVSVISAGVNAVPGRSADARALKVAREFGIVLDNHRAQVLTSDLVGQADAIFPMDYENEAQVLARYPQAAQKIFMLGTYADESYHQVEIPDPYWGDEAEVRGCYKILQGCLHNLARSLFPDWRSDGAKARELSTSI